MTKTALRLRDSREEDISAIARIYGHWVVHGRASFETEPPDEAEMIRRREALVSGGYPYLVAEDEATGAVLGYAYAGAYRPRRAYRFTVEDSIYVAPEAAGRGVGAALLPALLDRCEAAGFRLVVAVIGDSGNAPSIGLHKRFGFSMVGILPAIGWKHERWVDTVLMTKALGAGSGAPPPPGR